MCSAGSPCCGDEPIVEPRGPSVVPSTAVGDGGAVSAEACLEACSQYDHSYGRMRCQVDSSDAGGDADLEGGVRVQCIYETSTCSQPAGRRPAGHRERVGRGSTPLGAYFASIAALEAASVGAFEELARELAAHGAPKRLVARARRAARDEVRHAALVGELARRHGGAVKLPVARGPRPPRTLVALARANAVEGCVRETFGALLALHQAEFAPSADVRAAMTTIARDESAHAILAHDVHRWLVRRLDPKALRSVRAAARRARRRIEASPPAPVAGSGLPERAAAGALAVALHAALPLSA